jgi:hypothetical protein
MRTRIFAAAICLALTGISTGTASAQFGISAFDGASVDRTGAFFSTAGGHPYAIKTALEVNTKTDSLGRLLPDGQIKNLRLTLPPGLLGSASAVPSCPGPDALLAFACPNSAQVGVARLKLNSHDPFLADVPIYKLAPPLGVAARFGFQLDGLAAVLFDAGLDPGDGYRLVLDARSASQAEPLLGALITLWGTPADPSHDEQRCRFIPPESEICSGDPGTFGGPNPAGVEPVAFFTEPTTCPAPGEGLVTDLHLESWQDPPQSADAKYVSHDPPGFEALSLTEPPLSPVSWGPVSGLSGCDTVPFTPEVTVQPTSSEADSPTGLKVDLSMPTDGVENPAGIAQSHLKKAEVELPEGMAVNPAAAAGLGGCSSSQLAAETAASVPGAGCPNDSKIGTVVAETPLLDDPLTGSVYLATPHENPFGSLLAVYLVLRSAERGLIVTLPGRVDADPVSGRLTVIFSDLPQLPFSDLHIALKGGSRAPLVNPPFCGSYSTRTALTPWARPDTEATLAGSFNLSSGPNGAPCPLPAQFDPSFEAGTTIPIAGAYSPTVVNVARPDGSAPLTGLDLDLPPGLLARLRGVPACSTPAIAAASCPAASRVGTVDVGVGAGGTPFHLQGGVYLTGPYKGGALGLAIIVPALAGPFDLGDVVVRAALRVDPATAQITAVSDPIPTILQGIPLKVRSIALNANRPDFTLNPTSCNPFALSGTLFGTSTAKPVSSRFQVGACKALDFKPKLSLKLSGPTARSKNPALQAVLTQPAGQANIARVSVVLPRSAFIDNGHVSNPCTRVQFSAGTCPKNSILGTARAFTPLLDKPLEGPVYFRSNGGERDLPDIVADLNGQIHVTVVGFIDSVHKKGSETSRVRNTFALVPDAPVSKFVLNLKGGKVGLIENSANLCRSDQHATIKIDAQNGKAYDTQPLIGNGCGTGKKATRRG